ncbi:hypothetical protein AUH73_00570 [archaeon 13_1_40CM_4_53_4]|nr:MAG: hypothetical protein AUH73_00570 [archaeon 13_1_40CM_4_53_4]OLE58703.1 MAG: hypothetical protein AUG17_06705 [Crenarchaeota archaeon 13_1_20CM_2_53_14]
MKLGARTRLTLVVMLGVITGLGFIALPGILAVPSQSSPSTRTTGTNSTSGTTTAFNPNATVQLANSTKTQTPTETTITPGALPFLVSLIIVPALTLSLLTSTLVSRRTRKGLEKASEDDSSPS